MPQGLMPHGVITPIGLGHIQAVWASGTIDANTSFSTWLIGSTSVQITTNILFDKIKELESKFHILQELAKNTNVIFHWIAFSSEVEFNLWYFAESPLERV